MSDLQIDKQLQNDLVFEQGDLVLVTDLAYVQQRLRIRLDFAQGEWFLDTSVGVPYKEQILVRNPNLQVISAILRDRILSMPEIIRLTSFDLSFDNPTGVLRLTFTCVTPFGEAIAVSEAESPESLLLLLTLEPYGRVMTS